MSKENKAITVKGLKEIIDSQLEASNEQIVKRLEGIESAVNTAPAQEVKSNTEDGINQTRLITATIEAMINEKNGQPLQEGGRAGAVKSIIEERYGKKDPQFVKDFTARYKDLMATGNGGELIIEEYAQGFLDQLWDETILPRLGVRFLPTDTGNLRINKIIEGVAAGYIGEGGTIETSSLKFGHIRLSVKKMMALVPISNDLIRYSSINAEALVRDQIIKEMAQVADVAFLYGEGGEWEPLGITKTKGISKIEGNPVPSYDLGLDMLAALGRKNHKSTNLHWIMGWDAYLALQKETLGGAYLNKAELAQGKFHGHPIIVTNKIEVKDNKEDFLLLKSDAVTAIQGLSLSINSSQEASITVKGGKQMSAFAQDYTFVRAMIEHDFGLDYAHALVKAEVDVTKK